MKGRLCVLFVGLLVALIRVAGIAQEPDARTLILASHYDTVRNAGKYDGRLGILVPLVVVEHLHREGTRLPFNIEVIAFSEEEGVRFATSYIAATIVPTEATTPTSVAKKAHASPAPRTR